MIASAILLAAAALAKDLPPAGHASVGGVVEIPLYTAPAAGVAGWFIEAKIGDKPVLLQIATEVDGVELSESAAGRVGLKPTGKEGEKKASVKQIDIGGVVITGVKASMGKPAGTGIDGKIGPSSFPELAWAVLPSVGKVKLGPAGATSVASELGADTAYRHPAGEEPKVGKGKQKVLPYPVLVDVAVSGVKLGASLASGTARGRVVTEVDTGTTWFSVKNRSSAATPLPAVDGLHVADKEQEWRAVELGGVQTWARLDRVGAGLSYPFVAPARVGFDVLQHFDLGVDPSRKAITLKPNSGNSAASYTSAYLARVEEGLKPAAEPPSDPDAARKAQIGPVSGAASAYLAVGQYAKGVEHARKWTELEPERCTSWHALGGAMLATGDAAGALPHLRKAADMYAPWAARPLEERKDLAASEEKRAKRPDFDGVYSQPHSCFTATGDVATALVASGDGKGVAELYPSRLDLDAGLPRAAGTARLLSGESSAAGAAFRQAIKLSYGKDDAARAGMMLAAPGRDASLQKEANGELSDEIRMSAGWDGDASLSLALAQFVGNPDSDVHGVRYFAVYGETLRQAKGADGAIATIEAYLARAPWSIPGWLALASEQAAAGRDAAASVARAQSLLDQQLPWNPRSVALFVYQAEAHRLAGGLVAAAASADKAIGIDAASADALFVRARVAEAQGEATGASYWRKRAGSVAAANPLFGSLLGE